VDSTVGSMNAILTLLERDGPKLYALLFRLTLRRDVTDDLMQELFLKLESSRTFAAAGNPAAYVRRMAINLAMDWHRAGNHPTLPSANEEPAQRQELPFEQMARTETWNSALDALATLSEATREVVVRRYMERESYETIGRGMGKSAHQARAICHVGIKQLRQRLAARDEVCDA
jgi:RNA polymerase sigma factor (sigma-70 family)